MSIETLHDRASIQTNLSGLNQLRTQAINKDPDALKVAAQQFEGLLLSMMLKSMREANQVFSKDSIFGGKDVKFYEEMYDKQLTSSLSKKSQLGLADAIIRQLSDNQNGPELKKGITEEQYQKNFSADSTMSYPVAYASQEKTNSIPNGNKLISSDIEDNETEKNSKNIQSLFHGSEEKNSFISEIIKNIDKIKQKYDIDPNLLIAQSGLETGWGRKIINDEKGVSSNNLFGIKAGSSWTGKSVQIETTEYKSGQPVKIIDRFRQYDSITESIEDYLRLISSSSRYEDAWNSRHDPSAYTAKLQQAGYATDPKYAEKILNIYQNL